MKKLLVISNHKVENWNESQKRDWDEIVYLPFPSVDPESSMSDVQDIAYSLICKIVEITNWKLVYLKDMDGLLMKQVVCTDNGWYISVQGEFSLCFEIYRYFAVYGNRFVFPTTKRESIEQTIDGKTVKKSIFRFVKWRNLDEPEVKNKISPEVKSKIEEGKRQRCKYVSVVIDI